MNKKEVQKRISVNGKNIKLCDFIWCEDTNTFSSGLDNLVINFRDIPYCTFKTGSNCTFKTESYCTFDTWSNCTFDTGSNCTFKTGFNCTFKTGSDCTFDTGSDCTFDTWSDCTFDTGSDCTFDTWSDCTFKTGYNCVIVRRDMFMVIQNKLDIKLCPNYISCYIEKINDRYYLNGVIEDGEHVIIDGILSKVINKKQGIYHVYNYTKDGISNEKSYIIYDGDNYSHGKTLKEAKESLIFRISNRDTTKYQNIKIDSDLSYEESIKMYRVITGACEFGVKQFIDSQKKIDKTKKYKISEIIELTKGQFGNDKLVEFFKI